MVKEKLKKFKIYFLYILLITFLIILFIFIKNKYQKNILDININNNNQTKIYTLDLAMAGDNLINDKIYNEARRLNGYNGYNFKPMYSYVKDLIKTSDLAYINEETILGGEDIGVSSYPSFNSPYEVGDAIIDAGFNIISLANNHTLDRGEIAINNSLKYWSSKDVLTSGSYKSMEDRNKINIKTKNNISYTMLSYTYGVNGITVPKGKEYLVNIWPVKGNNPKLDRDYQEYKRIVKEDISRVRDKVDLLIVSMHWGKEYEFLPDAYQKDMAKFLAENDVDIVVGSHPHVVMPIEFIDDTLVIYSLGNLLSYQDTINDYDTVTGLISFVTITKKVNNEGISSISLGNLKNELIFTYYNNYRDIKIIPFSNKDSYKYIKERDRIYLKYSKIVKSLNEDIIIN